MQDVPTCKCGRKGCASGCRCLRIAGDRQAAECQNTKARHDGGDTIVGIRTRLAQLEYTQRHGEAQETDCKHYRRVEGLSDGRQNAAKKPRYPERAHAGGSAALGSRPLLPATFESNQKTDRKREPQSGYERIHLHTHQE